MSDTKNDGGTAFPATRIEPVRIEGHGVSYHEKQYAGMTLRDYFAGQALAGLLAAYSGPDVALPLEESAAMRAYEYADAMLAEREK